MVKCLCDEKNIVQTLDGGYAMAGHTDDGYVLCGYASSNNGLVIGAQGNSIPDIWIVKMLSDSLSTNFVEFISASFYPNPNN